MKTIRLNTLTCFFALSFLQSTFFSSAQVFNGKQANELVKGSSEVRIDQTRKSVSYVRLRENNFVSANEPEKWLLKSVFAGRKEDGLQLYKTESDKLGFTHLRYRQLYRNIPVEFSMYILHARNGQIISANGEFYPDITVPIQPSISTEDALRTAKSTIHAEVYNTDRAIIASPELILLKMDDGSFKLAYKTDIYTEKPLSRNWVYVDAVSNTVLKKINRIHTIDVSATAVTTYSGTRTIRTDSVSATNYKLREAARGTGSGMVTRNLNNGTNYLSASEFTNTSKLWPLAYDNAALDAHYGAEKTYDHYLTMYGYNSFNDSGAAILSYVHYSFDFVNAFWNGTAMTYGDGDGFQYSPLTSLEIVGHEITHGVTERSANLYYSGESGALNESFSDIMGNTIRFINDSADATWYNGDQIVIPGGGGTPFRNMANPNEFSCPDTYGGLFWHNGDVVHYDSGIQNFWYYLLTTGGTGVNDNGASYTVSGIGLTDANAIAFRNLTVYLTPTSTFADARTYSIQAAADLFGSCSAQVIQTTNAWHAVGVGGVFLNAVVSSFSTVQNYFCITPATVSFTNTSFNATSYAWNFGDGSTSTATNPSHVYTTPGTYTVQLIASGTAACGNSDTMTRTNYITVTNAGGPGSPNCIPLTASNCCGIGITRVQLNTINNISGNASEGYKDFTCSNATVLTAGDPYLITVTTGFTTAENVKAWIDFNNDGVFDNVNEIIFTSSNHMLTHSGIIHTPTTASLNTPLRMRIIDDNANFTITSACYNPQDGQAEDYTVSFIANILPPVTNFIASDTVINIGSLVNFSDLSIHGPTGWTWSFPGGTPSGSAYQNPSVLYNTLGTYAVTLRVSNSFGADSITKVAYIHVVNVVTMCSSSSTAVANGILYDSGGPTGIYQNYENCSLLINPSCALSITLSFSSFQTGSGSDYLRVYNGPNSASPLLLTASGSVLPASVTANSGQMYIVFTSNYNYNYPGFSATWTSVLASNALPVPSFSVSDSTPPLNAPVQFTDQSTNSPISWIWIFGDGGSSTLQNPVHSYNNPGTYQVTLIVFTCSQSAAITRTVTVQTAPSVTITPHSITASVACGSSVTVPIMIVNNGGGDLFVHSQLSGQQNTTLEVLALQYGVDMGNQYPNTISAINQYFTNYNLSTVYTTSPATLQAALVGKDVFLMASPSSGSPSVYTSFAPVLQNFVSNGGTAIICGVYSGQSVCIYNTGLFSGNYAAYTTSQTLNILNTSHFLLNGVTSPLSSSYYTYVQHITNPDKIKLVDYLGNDVVSYREIGSGRAIYVGFDFYSNASNNNSRRIIANAVQWAQSFLAPVWLDSNPDSVYVLANDTSYINVTLNSTGLNAGTYTYDLILATNDPLHAFDTIPVSMTISGPAMITLGDTCLNFGSIMQYSTSYDSVLVVNQGCDTLDITGISSSATEFTLQTASGFHVAPHDSAYIKVSFNPTTVGSFSGTLSIMNNDADTIICLQGSSFGAPVISVNPDSFNVTLMSGDSTTLPLTIYNTGLGNLVYNIQGNGNGAASDTSVLVIQEVSAWGLYMSSFLQTNFGIIPTVISSSQIAVTDFSPFDIVITTSGQSTLYYTNISNNLAKFQAFVAAGGIVQYQMASFSGAPNVNLAGGAVMVNGNAQNQNIGLLPAHPILNGITNPLTGSSANHCYLTNVPAGAQIISQTGTLSLPTTVEYSYGNGLVIASGMTWEWLYFNGYNAGGMLPNSIAYIFSKVSNLAPWLSVSATTDTVVPADSNVVDVEFNARNLNAGVYTAQLTINSNDPVTPQVFVPCTLHVTGIPKIVLSDTTINFGNVFAGGSAKDTLIVINTGTDTLTISTISSGNAAFTVNITTFNLLPGDSQNVVITFAPSSIAAYSSTLTILNNDNDTLVHLYGAGVAPPVMAVVPDSFDVFLNSCNDSIVLPLSIYNTGGSDLTYTITGAGTPGAVQVLALTYGTDLVEEYPNTIAAINQYFTNYTLTTINTTSAAVLQAALVGKSIFLMTEPETGSPSVYTGFASVLQNFVTNGGTVIMCGAYTNQSNCIFNTGLFSGTYGTAASGTVTVTNNSTPVTTGVASSFAAPNATFCLNITNANKVKLVDYQGSDVVTYRNIGAGKAIFLAFDYYTLSNNSARLIANAMQWASTNSIASWIKLSPSSGVLPVGDSDLVYITFNNAGLSGGTYHANLLIHSNDPLRALDTIECTLHVSFAPCVSIAYTISVCSGIVSFTSSSANIPTTYAWTFGDGGTSASPAPIYTYATGGTYSVQLIACNGAGCDTTAITLNLGNVGGPVAASCSPVTTTNCCGMGIYNVTFGNINNTTLDGSEGFQDYTCSDTTSVVKGQLYPISVTTGTAYNENVQVWIDYNNNGIFSSSELVFTSLNLLQYHSGTVLIPLTGVVVNTPLRMRVGSDYYINTVPQPCASVQYGQFEDYTLYITFDVGIAETPPVSGFNIYPDPFTDEATIEYTIEASKKVTLGVYNVIGEKVATIVTSHEQTAGGYKYKLKVAEAGVYLVVLTTEDGSVIRRIVRLD